MIEFSVGTVWATFTSRTYNTGNSFSTGTWITPTLTPSVTPTGTIIPNTPTASPTPTITDTPTPSNTPTPSATPTPSESPTPTITPTPSQTLTPSLTPTVTPPSTSGSGNSAVSFLQASSQIIDAGTGSSFNTLTTHATWEFWIKPVSVTSQHPIIGRWGDNWLFTIYNYNGSFLLFAYLIDANNQLISLNEGAWAYSNFQLDNWYHVAWVFDGTGINKSDRLKLYINGQQKTIDVFNGSSENIPSELKTSPSESVKIGADRFEHYYDGAIDNVSIWNISRSASEIQGDYLNELNGNESGLVAYWKMNEGTGTTIADSTANSNTGSFVNSPSWVGGYPQVVLNEMMPRPSSGEDWIEIFNRSNVNVNLNNWSFADSTSTIPISLNGIINSGAFQSFNVSDRLNMNNDTIQLKDEGGFLMDVKSYPPPSTADGISIGRSPDGTGDWKNCSTPSEDLSNNSSC